MGTVAVEDVAGVFFGIWWVYIAVSELAERLMHQVEFNMNM